MTPFASPRVAAIAAQSRRHRGPGHPHVCTCHSGGRLENAGVGDAETWCQRVVMSGGLGAVVFAATPTREGGLKGLRDSAVRSWRPDERSRKRTVVAAVRRPTPLATQH